ncbi:UvrD-helicase domain-containing protein [Propionibacteriaceae bacterium Y1923]
MLVHSLELFPQVSGPAPVVAQVAEPVLPAPVAPVVLDETQATEPARDLDDDEAVALMDALMAEPIEEWMAFLHPQQAKLVCRSFPGPSRVRGPAGSGKTVVGLHRAVHLARTRPGRVLMTTFVRTLPEVLKNLLTRMAPDVVDRVDFVGVHAFATRLLRDQGVSFRLDPKRADAAFAAAWQTVGRAQLGDLGQSSQYWSDELQYVLKGRGITRFEEYADLAPLDAASGCTSMAGGGCGRSTRPTRPNSPACGCTTSPMSSCWPSGTCATTRCWCRIRR